MAKIIKITAEYIEQCKQEFATALKSYKLSDGKLTYSKSFTASDRKAKVYFTSEAWEKMQALINGFDKEVAWHGLAYRGDGDDYYITDILVYPQEVTGSTVNTDQEKYQTWLMQHDDEVFNNIRMQGHSHVNMSTGPSSVDDSLYERILDQLSDSMFYIFLIYNKRGEKTFKIYDLAKNILFETGDVTVEVLPDNSEQTVVSPDGMTEDEHNAVVEFLRKYRVNKRMEAFVAHAKEMVQAKTYSAPAKVVSGPIYGRGYYEDDYYSRYNYGGYSAPGYYDDADDDDGTIYITGATQYKQVPQVPKVSDVKDTGRRTGKRSGRR